MAFEDISSTNTNGNTDANRSDLLASGPSAGTGNDDEPELIARVLAGDRSAYRPLVEVYEPAVYGICRRWLGSRETEAEDLSQETFLRAYCRLAELRDRQRFGPWLYRIARSLCRDWIRKVLAERRALERRLDLERWAAAGGGVDEDMGFTLASLPAEERRVLELKYFEGLSYREVARRMDLTFSRVDHLIRRARSRLSRRVTVKRLERERSL